MDATFWAAVGFVVFLAICWYYGAHTMMNRSLDERAARVRNELDEARELKEEARQQLAEYQRRRNEAEAEAEEMIAAAKREAKVMLDEARVKSEDYVKRRTAMAEQKIAQAEADAVAEVRATAVDVAVAASAKIIADRNSGEDRGRFIDQSIAAVAKRLQ